MLLPLLLLAGISLHPLTWDEPVLDLRVVDIDADGKEDLVAVTRTELLLRRGGAAEILRRPAPPLTVVGHGLLGVVREGRYRPVKDPFGGFVQGEPAEGSLLAQLSRGDPILLSSPGDLDGDGRDDAVLFDREGCSALGARLPVVPAATLEIKRNEEFAVRYEIPVPVLGGWSAPGRELVFFQAGEVLAFRGTTETDRVTLPLSASGKSAEEIRRNHVFLRDVDADGRLDMLVVTAKGSTGFFGAFEATVLHFAGGRIYDREHKGFHRPASFLKVSGALLHSELLDLDGDGDLDLVLSTINTSLLAAATGTAPGTYHLFRFANGVFRREPAWTHRAPVPLSAFTENPRPPIMFLPDLDGDGEPEALVLDANVGLLRGMADGTFRAAGSIEFARVGPLARGRTFCALAGSGGILLVEREP